MTYASPLRSCSAGEGFWLGHNSKSFGGQFLCPLRQWSLMRGFDPQPYGQGGTDQRVKFIDPPAPPQGVAGVGALHAERWNPEFVVLARDGDVLSVRRLGFPDEEPVTVSVYAVYPASPGAVYRHASKCGPAPSTEKR